MIMKLGYVWAFCLFLSVSCISEKGDEISQTEVVELGDKLPEFTVTLNDGSRLSTHELTGKLVLVLFFNTSCGDCREELPRVQQVYERFGEDGRVVFLAVSREETDASIRRFWVEHGLTLPYSAQPDRTVYHLFARSSIPRIYVADKEQVIRAIYTDNPLATVNELNGALENMLEN